MRTFDEFRTDIQNAVANNDEAALFALADELASSAELEAEALEHTARGNAEQLSGRFTIAVEHFERARDLDRDLGFREAQASDEASLGQAYAIMGVFPTALEHLHQALTIREELNDRSGQARILQSLGQVHNDSGDYPMALDFYHRSLTLFEELGDRPRMARLYTSVGNAHANSGNHQDALSLYSQAMDLYEELGDRVGVADVLVSQGTLMVETDRYPEALEEYRRALQIHEEFGNTIGMVWTMVNIAFVLMDTGDLDEASVMEQRIADMGITEPRFRTVHTLLQGRLLELKGALDEAHNTLMAGLKRATDFGLRGETSDLHLAVRDLAVKRDEFKTYLEHNAAFVQLTDEIRGRQAALKMAMAQKARELEGIERERDRERAVLYSTLPQHVADRMIRGEKVTDQFESASVLFMDIAGFTRLSDHLHAEQVVSLLEEIFRVCDTVCGAHGVTKVKTIGDSYLAVSGVPEPLTDHAHRMALAALDMLDGLRELEVFLDPALGDISWVKDVGEIKVRFGVHCGPLVAGIVGSERLQYDIWGDTVNTSSRMESTGEPGRIQVSPVFATELHRWIDQGHTVPYRLSERGEIQVKGKGLMTTFWLERA